MKYLYFVLQLVCDILKENLEQLPGDARTQIGVICYDAHIHYYVIYEGLTRPKEMTVLDIDGTHLNIIFFGCKKEKSKVK